MTKTGNIDLSLLTNQRIFVTGGTGFVGKNLLKFLLDHDIAPQQVTVLTRDTQKFNQKYPELCNQRWLDFEQADIRDLEWNNQKYDYFIHAATSVVDQSESITLFDEIVIGTKKALTFAQKANVKVFINLSSGAVYHLNSKLGGLKETSPLLDDLQSGRSTYGLAKIAAEHLAYLYSKESNMRVVTLRCFCFAGAYLEPTHFAIGEFVQKALSNEDIVVQAGSGIYRSYLAASDLARQMFEVLILATIHISNYEVYNLGSDEAISLPDLAHKVVKVLGSESKVITPNLDSINVNYYVPDINKLNSILEIANYSILENIITNLAKFYQTSISRNFKLVNIVSHESI